MLREAKSIGTLFRLKVKRVGQETVKEVIQARFCQCIYCCLHKMPIYQMLLFELVFELPKGAHNYRLF